MNGDEIDREVVLTHLDRILSSKPFRQAERSAALLRYLVTRSLDGEGDRLKEYTVGVEGLSRGEKFDPRTDPIVRAEASRLRGRLERYYRTEGATDTVIIALPKGSYVPRISRRAETNENPTPVDRRRREWGLGMVGALALATAFAAGAWSAGQSNGVDELFSQFDVELQADEEIASVVGTDVAMSPDGSAAVYVSIDSIGRTHLRLKRFDDSAPVNLPQTIGGRGPFWSPDSRWVAFWANGQLLKIAVAGGQPVVLCDAPDLLGGSWGSDGMIIAAIKASFQLWRVDADSRRPPEVALDLTEAGIAPRWPQILPGGTHVLYTSVTAIGDDRAGIEVASLKTGERRVLVQGGTFARYVAPRHLTFVNQGTLFTQPFDVERLRTSGPPVPIASDVAYSPVFGYAQVSISETGHALFRRSYASNLLTVDRLDSTGRRNTIIGEPGLYGWPSLSPDGRRLAISAVKGGVPMLTMYTNVGGNARLAWSIPNLDAAVWTRDGSAVVARLGAGQQVAWLPASGGEPQTLFTSSRINVPWTFAPGDSRLYFAAMDTLSAFDIWTTPIEKNGASFVAGEATPLLQSRAYETYPAVSRDGRWLAYASNQGDLPGVYVRSLTDTSASVLVAPAGRAPRWSRSGNRLFLVMPNHQVMSVTFRVRDGHFEADPPRLWSTIRLADTGVFPNYDVGLDDASIIALVPTSTPRVNQVTMIRGLRAELQRRAP